MEPCSPTDDERHAYLCPVSQQLMCDPVVAADGHTYERSAIESWFRVRAADDEPPTSPATGAVLPSAALLPNYALRIAIEASALLHARKHAHGPPDRSPEPPAKRPRSAGEDSVEPAESLAVTTFMQQAEPLVEAGDVPGLLDAMRALGRVLARPAVRAEFFPPRLVAALAKGGLQPILDSLLCHQECEHLVFLQALAVVELSASELAGVEPTLAGAIAALNCADQHGLTLLLECAAQALAQACASSHILTPGQVQQLADALCLVVRPKHGKQSAQQRIMQLGAIQRAMEGLVLLVDANKQPFPGLVLLVSGDPQPGAHASSISRTCIEHMAHAAMLQLERNTGPHSRQVPRDERVKTARAALELLSSLVCYRMWSRGVQHFLSLVVGTVREYPRPPLQVHAAVILAKCCQFGSYDTHVAVQRTGLKLLVDLVATFAPGEGPDSRITDTVVAACQGLQMLLKAHPASAFARDRLEMQPLRAELLADAVQADALEALVLVLDAHYTYGHMPPPQVLLALLYCSSIRES